MSYQIKYQEYLEYFNNSYNEFIASLNKDVPTEIKDAVIYATIDGGKRVRPILCYATCEALGVSLEKVKEFALAIEFIHSYSLVHDDLPCMDNDDYRRGKLSTHKKFGEAYGVLAGDALLNLAFEACLSKNDFSLLDAKALKILADFAGYKGMIGGQVLDLKNERNPEISENVLYDIYINKTSKLLTAPLLISSTLANDKFYDELYDFGIKLGILFQITDDILDEESSLENLGKTPHKDAIADKFTSIKVFGIDGAKQKAKGLFEDCHKILRAIPNNAFLAEFLNKLYYRKK